MSKIVENLNYAKGYADATEDISKMLVNLPKKHNSPFLFNKDIYIEEFKEFVKPETVLKRIEKKLENEGE